MATIYPDDCLQSLVGTWWISAETSEVRRGSLAWSFIPYVDQEPLVLIPEGRSSPTDHTRALFTIEPLRAANPPKAPALPVAALPSYPGEVRAVYRAKRRPVLILSVGGADIPRQLRVGAARWQTNPTVLVAPYFGVEPGPRGGWKPEFVERIRHCEYPQYVWDKLPIGGSAEESVLLLSQMQPIGNHANAYKLTEFCLSDEALVLLDEWLVWLMTGKLDQDGLLYSVREGLLDL